MYKQFLFIIPVLLILLGIVFMWKNNGLIDTRSNTDTNTGVGQNKEFMLPPGFSISTYINLNGPPRDLETDMENTIFISIPTQGKILAITDTSDSKDKPEIKEIITGLKFPHGLAYYNNKLFVAEENQVSRYDWNKKNSQANLEKVLFSLPSGGRHRSRSLVFGNDGKLYISIGSTCDACYESDPRHGSILVSDFEGTAPKIFASGLRNAVFLTTNPASGQLFSTEMGRDNLGDNLPPDEINIVTQNSDYGWPLCYGDKTYDNNFAQTRNLPLDGSCDKTIDPAFKIHAHSAPLGLTFVNSQTFPNNYQGSLLVALHGSWNSTKLVGYKVIQIELQNGKPAGETDFITGFLQNGKSVMGRPVDMVFDNKGLLYLSDDKSNRIYQITYLK